MIVLDAVNLISQKIVTAILVSRCQIIPSICFQRASCLLHITREMLTVRLIRIMRS